MESFKCSDCERWYTFSKLGGEKRFKDEAVELYCKDCVNARIQRTIKKEVSDV
jgi:hypothetical protein